MNRRCGFTLLELLVALTLTISVALVAVGWLHQIGRSSAAFAREREISLAVSACLDLLRDDCVQAVAPPVLGEDGTLVLHCLSPAQAEVPGLREVRWRFDAERRCLVRSLPGAIAATLVADPSIKAPSLPLGALTTAFSGWKATLHRGVLEVLIEDGEGRQVRRRVWSWQVEA